MGWWVAATLLFISVIVFKTRLYKRVDDEKEKTVTNKPPTEPGYYFYDDEVVKVALDLKLVPVKPTLKACHFAGVKPLGLPVNAEKILMEIFGVKPYKNKPKTKETK